MKHTLRTVATVYLVAAIWFAVMVAVAFSAIALIDGSALLSEAGATVRSGLAMGTAVLVASLAAAAAWTRLHSTAAASRTEQQPLEDDLRAFQAQQTA